jgi:hypothetical protein
MSDPRAVSLAELVEAVAGLDERVKRGDPTLREFRIDVEAFDVVTLTVNGDRIMQAFNVPATKPATFTKGPRRCP